MIAMFPCCSTILYIKWRLSVFFEGPPAKKLIELHPAAAGRMGPGDSAAQFLPVQVLVNRWTFDARDDDYTVILLLDNIGIIQYKSGLIHHY